MTNKEKTKSIEPKLRAEKYNPEKFRVYKIVDIGSGAEKTSEDSLVGEVSPHKANFNLKWTFKQTNQHLDTQELCEIMEILSRINEAYPLTIKAQELKSSCID